MTLSHSTFATGLFATAAVFAAVLFAPMDAAEAGSLNASSPQQFAQANSSNAIAQCKTNCAAEYNSCVKGGCVGGSGPGGKCTKAEAIAGCNDKYGSRKATCIARCTP